MIWTPTQQQTLAAQGRVGQVWAGLLADRHPGHRFVIEWRERPELLDAPALPRQISGHVVDKDHGRSAA